MLNAFVPPYYAGIIGSSLQMGIIDGDKLVKMHLTDVNLTKWFVTLLSMLDIITY